MASPIDPKNFQVHSSRQPEDIVDDILEYPIEKTPSEPFKRVALPDYPFSLYLLTLIEYYSSPDPDDKPEENSAWSKILTKEKNYREFVDQLQNHSVSRDAIQLVELIAQDEDAQADRYKQSLEPHILAAYDLDKLIDVRAELRDNDVQNYIIHKRVANNLRTGIKPLLRELAAVQRIRLDEGRVAGR